MKTTKLAACLCVFLLVGVSSASAQGVGASGDIKGTITDPSGAVLPGAEVLVTNVDKGIRHTVTTGEGGEYRITGLAPAVYNVTVKSSGFQTQVMTSVRVTVGQTAIVDFQLQVSAVATEVVVTTEAPLVETEKTQQANTLEQRYIQELPIDRRDYLTYTLLMPGVVDSNAFADNTDFRVVQTPQSGLSFYGSNGRGNSVTVDGSEANDDSGGVRLTLGQDAVQEFQINRSNFSAEFGGASGGVINIVSKSGTNEVHGSAFGFFRHDSLDARDPFAIDSALKPGDPFSLTARGQAIDPESDRQQFGGSIGFPITRDKSFLFLSYEGLRKDESASVPLLTDSSIFGLTAEQAPVIQAMEQSGVPALAAQGACLRALLTVDPTSGSPSFCLADPTLAFFEGIASVTEPSVVNLFVNSSGVFPFAADSDLFSARLDHQFDDNDQLFVRYNFGNSEEVNSNIRALIGFSRGNQIAQFDHTGVLGWFHQFSPRAQNEARVMVNYNDTDFVPNQPLGPEISLPGFGFFNRDIFLPSFTILRRYEFADNATFITGRHKLKFGGKVLLRDNHSESHTFFTGRFQFGPLPGAALGLPFEISSLQAFKLGIPQFYQQGFDNPTVESMNPLYAFYVQDTWNPISNLTFNFGLRYEFDDRRTPLPDDTNNFAPRFGFSWDPFGDHKTVIRGGYGIYYSPIYYQIDYVAAALGVVDDNDNQINDRASCASGSVTCFRQIAQVFMPSSIAAPCPALESTLGLPSGALGSVLLGQCIFQTLMLQGVVGCSATNQEACITPANLTQFIDPFTLSSINITHTGPIPPLTVLFSGADDYVNPYSQQGSFGIEREVAPNFSVSVDYIYSYTLKITRARDKNILPGGGFVNPLILQDNVYESTGKAFYHGFILSVNKRFSNHFSFFANYTFSKAIDEVTDFNSDFQPSDQTNLRAERSLSAFDQRHKFVVASVIDSPWFTVSPIIRANSGRPFNLLAGADLNADRHSTTDRPPFIGRNTGRGPNFWTVDLRVSRKIGLGERANLEVLAEAFNLFNRLNFASVNNTVGATYAGPLNPSGDKSLNPSQPLGFTSAAGPRRFQLGVRLNF